MMTQFETLLLGRIDSLTSEVGRMATAVARLEERQIAHDDRLEDLERTPAPRSATASARSRWCATKDIGVSAAAIVALVTAIAQAVHTPPAMPPAPAPRPAAVAGP